LKNTQFVIANEVKQSHKPFIIKEIATAHMRLAMTEIEFLKGLSTSKYLKSFKKLCIFPKNNPMRMQGIYTQAFK
jgi:hypothetical protein